MKPFKVSPAMTADLQAAYDYFKRGGPSAAERFLVRYEEAMRGVRQNPQICRVRPSGWRQWATPRSSFALFYREAPGFWLVAAVISTVQDPDMIQAQLLIREIGES